MDASENEILFELAVADYRRGSFPAAKATLSRLVEDGSRDPAHLSYYGLLLALTGEKDRSLDFCEEAVIKDGRRASLLYLNLARALDAVGRKRDAIVALERGLLLHPEERQMKNYLQHLVPRARPLFPSLGRRHLLNRYYGMARTASGRFWFRAFGRAREV
ncbi:MAG: tetratricopeptide repeat protein [Vicinamibacteria bacterium]